MPIWGCQFGAELVVNCWRACFGRFSRATNDDNTRFRRTVHCYEPEKLAPEDPAFF